MHGAGVLLLRSRRSRRCAAHHGLSAIYRIGAAESFSPPAKLLLLYCTGRYSAYDEVLGRSRPLQPCFVHATAYRRRASSAARLLVRRSIRRVLCCRKLAAQTEAPNVAQYANAGTRKASWLSCDPPSSCEKPLRHCESGASAAPAPYHPPPRAPAPPGGMREAIAPRVAASHAVPSPSTPSSSRGQRRVQRRRRRAEHAVAAAALGRGRLVLA